MVERGFSEAPENLAKTDKWQRIYLFAKIFGWNLEDMKKLSGKEARILMNIESNVNNKNKEQYDLMRARIEAQNMLKRGYG